VREVDQKKNFTIGRIRQTTAESVSKTAGVSVDDLLGMLLKVWI